MNLIDLLSTAQSSGEIEQLLASMNQPPANGSLNSNIAPDPRLQQTAQFVNPQALTEDDIMMAKLLMTGVAPYNASQEQKNVQEPPVSQPTMLPGKIFGDAQTGAERVNYYTQEHGVRAITDPKTGQVTLTNLDDAGKPTPQSQKQIYGFNPKDATSAKDVINPTTPNDKGTIDRLMSQISEADTSEQAEVLTRSLRLAVADENSRLEQEAYSFAEQELGIAALKSQAEALRARDALAARVNGVPFISPEYTQVTQLLSQRQQAANARANEWLTRNVTYNRLKAVEKNASVLVDQKITKLGAAELRAAEKQERFTSAFESIPESQRELVYRIDPKLRNASPETVINAVARLGKNKQFEEYVNSTEPQRLALAIAGNPFAFQTIAEDEAAITNRPVEDVVQEMTQIASMEPTTDMIKAYAARQLQALPPEQRKEEEGRLLSSINQARMGSTKEEKARYQEIKGVILAQEFKSMKTRNYMTRVESWGIQDPSLTAAINKAREVTGSTSMDKVLAAYVNVKEGPEALAAVEQFKGFLRQATEKNEKSKLGSPDQAAMLNVVNNTIIQSGTLANWIRQRMGMMIATKTNATEPVAPQLGFLGLFD